MTQHFTTPEFSQVLKQHGIDTETSFCYYQECNGDGQLQGFDYLGLKSAIGIVDVQTGEIIEREKAFEVSPTYPLTQVLGWLPNEIYQYETHNGFELEMWQFNQQYHYGYRDEEQTPMYNQNTGTRAFKTSIEDLIIQGLTEGWINKDNLNLAK